MANFRLSPSSSKDGGLAFESSSLSTASDSQPPGRDSIPDHPHGEPEKLSEKPSEPDTAVVARGPSLLRRVHTRASALPLVRRWTNNVDAESQTSTNHEKQMRWHQATEVMIAETISLGILSLAYSELEIGLGFGTALIPFTGIVTTLTGLLCHRLFVKIGRDSKGKWLAKSYPQAVTLALGRPVGWLAEAMLSVFLFFLMAAHIAIFSNALRIWTGGSTCNVVWSVIGALIMIVFTLPRTFKSNSYFSIVSCCSIITATFATIIDLAITHHSGGKYSALPSLGSGLGGTTWPKIFLGLSNIIVSYTGHMAYFSIMTEMEDPERDFPKALYATNIVTTTMYTIAGTVIYYLAGNSVKSPALSSGTHTGQIVVYALAIPTIIVAGVIAALLQSKRLVTAVLPRNSDPLTSKSLTARWSWKGIVIGNWLLAWVIANVLPFFNELLAIIGALIGTWLCLGFPALFWLCFLRMTYEGPAVRKHTYSVLASILLLICVAACVTGMYGSVDGILKNIDAGTGGWGPFSCAPPPGSG